MIHRALLLSDLQRLLPAIEADILAHAEAHPEVGAGLEREYRAAREAGRTGEHFIEWRAQALTQGAGAWLLSCVFVRFLEDNELLEAPWLAGPAGARLQAARDRLTVYFREYPTHGEREYLLAMFEALAGLPGLGDLLDRRHNPLWRLPVSGDGAKRMLDFFQGLEPESGVLRHDFTDAGWDTRFLGDLYQDLSAAVRKRYALLQTPAFVEAFILDHTLTPALAAFGLPGLRVVDPTCGSGHFLLTAFERLFEAWCRRDTTTNSRALAQRALDGVYGVDVNPYAVAIARFRLLIAALRAAGSRRIDRQGPDFRMHLAVGDSLLHGTRHEWGGQGIQTDALDDPTAHFLAVEDREAVERILGQRYHVVVGNPPYITVKDKALNQAYRDRYPTCHRQYSLGVPFTERFFDLCEPARGSQPAGFVGMITANSFMKREFGKKLIEAYLPGKDLTHVIDTSGAYIPGHGTPTVILFARNQAPQHDQLRAVLGTRGEPTTPENPEQGKVWQSIVEMLEQPESENDYISVVDQERGLYATHPWSVGGGGAGELKVLLEDAQPLGAKINLIGFGAILGEDDVFGIPTNKIKACRFPQPNRSLVEGDLVRDWRIDYETKVLFPYDKHIQFQLTDEITKYLWSFRNLLSQRQTFGKKSYREAGRSYAEYHQIPAERNRTPLSITFAEVATHNHFVLDRGGKVFKQTAPVIKLSADSTEDDHLALLGLLNSSTACFWIKQVFHCKGSTVDTKGARQITVAFENFYQIAGTGLKNFPIPADPTAAATTLAQHLDHLAQQRAALDPATVLAHTTDQYTAALESAQTRAESLTRQMIALQEELDWLSYRLYALTDDDLTAPTPPPELALGERPFEIALARRMASGDTTTTWFERHGSRPITEIPPHWPADYRALTERRLQAITDNPWIRLIEQPEYKRRWNQEPWPRRQHRALAEWLLDSLESLTRPTDTPRLHTCAQLADRARHDPAFQQIATLYTGTDTFDPQALVSELVATDHVPAMAAARYKPQSLPKFRAWQETWDQQRQEDAIDARTALDPGHPDHLSPDAARALKRERIGDIPLPPKYAQTDFRHSSFWSLRGKLDVPKERFFSLPGCEKAGDATLVIGWAGLDHLQRAHVIAAWYLERKEQEGWDAPRLMPLLVALDELIPWLRQWHNAIDPEFGEALGDYYAGFLAEELRELGIGRDELAAWQPAASARGRRARA